MYYLSLSDLLLIEDFVKAFSEGDKDKELEILYHNGMDTEHEITEEIVTHRNLRNMVVTCVRYVGRERADKDWLRSGAASVDAWVNSTDDESLQEVMKGMSKEGYSGRYDKKKDTDGEEGE